MSGDMREKTALPATGRRRFLIGSALTGAAPLIARGGSAGAAETSLANDVRNPVGIELEINERTYRLNVDTPSYAARRVA